jgi:hypothetical protein
MGTSPVGAGSCKLTPAPPNQVQCDYHSTPGTVTFSVAVYSGHGSVAFAAISLDGHAQPLNPPAVTLAQGAHKVLFILAFSDPTATAVIREACNPAQDLALVDAASPNETLRICVP